MKTDPPPSVISILLPITMPAALDDIIHLFEELPESERRGLLVHYADSARHCAPQPGETFDLEDVRKDEECTDTVGIHLRSGPFGPADSSPGSLPISASAFSLTVLFPVASALHHAATQCHSESSNSRSPSTGTDSFCSCPGS